MGFWVCAVGGWPGAGVLLLLLLILAIGAPGRGERTAGENVARMLFQDLLATVMLMGWDVVSLHVGWMSAKC
jgi:hypothetical protein